MNKKGVHARIIQHILMNKEPFIKIVHLKRPERIKFLLNENKALSDRHPLEQICCVTDYNSCINSIE